MLNWKSYQVSKPEMEFRMIDIIYVALPIHTHKQKINFFYANMISAKLYIYIGVGVMNLYIDEAKGAGHIPLCSIF